MYKFNDVSNQQTAAEDTAAALQLYNCVYSEQKSHGMPKSNDDKTNRALEYGYLYLSSPYAEVSTYPRASGQPSPPEDMQKLLSDLKIMDDVYSMSASTDLDLKNKITKSDQKPTPPVFTDAAQKAIRYNVRNMVGDKSHGGKTPDGKALQARLNELPEGSPYKCDITNGAEEGPHGKSVRAYKIKVLGSDAKVADQMDDAFDTLSS